MKNKVYIVLFLLFFSCTNKKETLKEKSPEETIFIYTLDVKGNEPNQVKTESLTSVTEDYFEVGLYSYRQGDGTVYYMGKKDLKVSTVGEEFRYSFFKVVNFDKSELKFESSTDFLNFISKRGYEMVDQKKEKYVTHYTFKKITDSQP